MYRIGRMAAIGIPVWLVLLVLLPLSGLGALACLSIATALAAGASIWVERRRSGRDRPAPGPPAARQIGPLGAAALTLGVVVLLIYVVFVIRST